MITIADLDSAYSRISSLLPKTPVLYSSFLSKAIEANVYLKLDNFQRTGSFKERGAINRLLTLTKDEKAHGVVTASAGNHAQAVAYHATQMGIKSTIFMPVTTPLSKLTRTRDFGGEVVVIGNNYDEAHEAAEQFSKDTHAFYVHAYDDEQVVAGQASIAREVFDQIEALDMIVAPVGGGGLISGIALCAQALQKDVRIIGVEPERLPSMQTAIQKGGPFKLEAAPTIADGIRVRRVGQITFDICNKLVNEWVSVSDDEIAHALLHLIEYEKIVTEAAGAAGVSALFSESLKNVKGKNICVIICGGNIDLTLLSRVLERGMVETGRLVKLVLSIHDRPGELGELLQMIGKLEANVLEVHHERAFANSSWNDVVVDLVLETKGNTHVQNILLQMQCKGYLVTKVENAGTKGWLRPKHL